MRPAPRQFTDYQNDNRRLLNAVIGAVSKILEYIRGFFVGPNMIQADYDSTTVTATDHPRVFRAGPALARGEVQTTDCASESATADDLDN